MQNQTIKGEAMENRRVTMIGPAIVDIMAGPISENIFRLGSIPMDEIIRNLGVLEKMDFIEKDPQKEQSYRFTTELYRLLMLSRRRINKFVAENRKLYGSEDLNSLKGLDDINE